jgi:hypothetical protein
MRAISLLKGKISRLRPSGAELTPAKSLIFHNAERQIP